MKKLLVELLCEINKGAVLLIWFTCILIYLFEILYMSKLGFYNAELTDTVGIIGIWAFVVWVIKTDYEIRKREKQKKSKEDETKQISFYFKVFSDSIKQLPVDEKKILEDFITYSPDVKRKTETSIIYDNVDLMLPKVEHINKVFGDLPQIKIKAKEPALIIEVDETFRKFVFRYIYEEYKSLEKERG